MNSTEDPPQIETRYHPMIGWAIFFGVLMFAAGSIASFWFGVIHSTELSNRLFWVGFCIFFGYLSVVGSRLIPFQFASIILNPEGLRIIRGQSDILYHWKDIKKVSYHNRMQILDVYTEKRILSIDYYIKDFSYFSYTLDFYTKPAEQGAAANP